MKLDAEGGSVALPFAGIKAAKLVLTDDLLKKREKV